MSLLARSDGATLRDVTRASRPIDERFSRPAVMGVLNVTPDSFSDGGRFMAPADAIAHGRRLAAEGAALVDVGGESTRPGAEAVTVEEELRRVEPVLEGLAGIPVSIDTSKAAVARRALELGAEMVNDVTALRGDPEMASVVAEGDAFLCLMHMQGEPRTMQAAPHYDDVVAEVKEYLRGRIEAAEWAGIRPQALAIDPGIGFGKNLEHNLALIRHLDALADLGRPILVGPSRKRFIGAILDLPEGERVEGTAGAVAWLVGRGAHIVRVHDVRQIVRVVRVVDAIVRAEA